jgi:hypothetical protein
MGTSSKAQKEITIVHSIPQDPPDRSAGDLLADKSMPRIRLRLWWQQGLPETQVNPLEEIS